MHYELDDYARQKIDDLLRDDDVPTALLAAIPELAKQERLKNALKEGLRKLPLYARVMCAEILDHIGEQEGTDHLVYNSMAYHPLLKYNQTGAKDWGNNGVRIADKLNKKHVDLMVKDMIKHHVFHGPTLAFANVETIIPAMLNLMDAELPVKRFASYVLAYHGNDAGAATLRDWAIASPFPQMPLEALSLLPGDEWLAFLESFADPSHPLYDHERYGGTSQYLILPSLRIRLALKMLSDVHEKAAFLYAEYGRTLNEVEVYSGNRNGDKTTSSVNPPVAVLTHVNKTVPPGGIFAPDILTDLQDHPLQAYLAERQRDAVKQLIEKADLRFENILDGKTMGLVGFMCGLNRVRGLHITRFLKTEINSYGVPVRIFYDTDDYLNAATDWIVNPLRHRSLGFGYVM